ncbi:MAG TPA: hypothetical protein VF450_12875 [Noviherbaspirillum sp.]
MSKTKIHYPQWKERAASNNPRREIGYWELVDAITLTAEVCGQVLSRAAAEMLIDDLAGFSEEDLMAALARCRLELQGPLRVAEIILRLEDGRPAPEEAWAMVPLDEQASVVWTEEVAHAWGVVLPLLEDGELSAAQAAFRDAYVKLVLDARLRREPVRWIPSLGRDVTGRERVLHEAVALGRLSANHAEQLLGAAETDEENLIVIGHAADIKKLH